MHTFVNDSAKWSGGSGNSTMIRIRPLKTTETAFFRIVCDRDRHGTVCATEVGAPCKHFYNGWIERISSELVSLLNVTYSQPRQGFLSPADR